MNVSKTNGKFFGLQKHATQPQELGLKISQVLMANNVYRFVGEIPNLRPDYSTSISCTPSKIR